ncbi:DUF2975 domain-containing protein [Cellulomonas sp. ATA003]|uniref:DUF2975 domain-containing protein n=1 Tax=Cellulomonas sp. ATA003 TaxID=3073064 RepID=UPI002873738D|nr:DUF2975 domain-containing protein [Cellulomonas sp. ATA003]WNB86302.1 DUF2975 domain-containing protein [Cellulomonas sp. ATA003]
MDAKQRWRALTANEVYVGPRTTRLIAALLLVFGAVAAIGGLGYAIDGATQAPATVSVPVGIEEWPGSGHSGPVYVEVDGVELPDRTSLRSVGDGLVLVDDTGASRWIGFLARGDAALGGLAVGLCAVLLAPVVRSIAVGEPFRRGNAARIGGTAGTVLIAGLFAPVLPEIAGLAVLDDLGLGVADDPFVLGFGVDLAPIAFSALLFVVAEAFRRGTQIADDAAGLV